MPPPLASSSQQPAPKREEPAPALAEEDAVEEDDTIAYHRTSNASAPGTATVSGATAALSGLDLASTSTLGTASATAAPFPATATAADPSSSSSFSRSAAAFVPTSAASSSPVSVSSPSSSSAVVSGSGCGRTHIALVRILHNPPVQNCELRPFVLLRDGSTGNQVPAQTFSDPRLVFSWHRGQQRLCSVTHCNGGAKLQCLMCLKVRMPAHLSYFCSTEHWAESWPAHRQLHGQALQKSPQSSAWDSDEAERDGVDLAEDDKQLQEMQRSTSDYEGLTCRFPPMLRNVWGEVSTARTYTPRQDDVGRMLHLEVKLTLDGDDEDDLIVCKDTSPVLPEPEAPPPRVFMYHPTANPNSPNVFRVMCYNTLAAIYATKHVFPYCALWALLWNYRRNMILRELRAHRSDIICLQEIQGDHFDEYFQPELKKLGYDGIFKMKTRAAMGHKPNSMDGCAIFYKTDRFALMEQYSIEFNEAARQRIDARNEFRSSALRRLSKGNVALVVVLEEIVDVSRRQRRQRKRRLCVANTHIFWDPEFEDVKLWQTFILCQELEKLVLSRNLPLVLCGDFNSKPDSPVYELMGSERVHPDHEVFHMASEFDVLPPPEAVTHRLPLMSAYGPHEPRYTNFTGSFVGVLDYIFFTKNHLRALGYLEMPEEDVVSEFTALPSPRFPSDHLPLVADFDWLNT